MSDNLLRFITPNSTKTSSNVYQYSQPVGDERRNYYIRNENAELAPSPTPQLEYDINPTVISTKIYDLNDDNYHLKESLDIVLEIYPDEVIALMPELELTGDGRNPIEAIRELKNEILDLYDELIDTPNEELGKFLKSRKRTLALLIEKVS